MYGEGAALPLTFSSDNIQLETTVTTLVNDPCKTYYLYRLLTGFLPDGAYKGGYGMSFLFKT